MKVRVGARLSKEEIISRLNDKNIKLLSEYTVMKDKGHFKCGVCNHEWKTIFESVVCRKNGCPRCAGQYKTNETINEDLKDKPFKFIDNYKGIKNKYKFMCNCGNIFETTIPASYTRKGGCGKCNKIPKNNEIFLNKLMELNYELLDIYTRDMDDVRLKCNKHDNEWITKPNYILNGHGRCKECCNEKIKENKKLREYEKFKAKINNDIFVKLIGEFKGFDSKTEFECLVCGNIYTTKPVYYYYNDSRCPMCKASKGELAIIEYLNKKNIKYEHEYSFDDFKGKRNRLYRFDFAILGKRNGVKALIEYDGIMHYKKKRKEQDLFECMERDNVKSEYAKKKRIKLIRIPYWEFDNIENILDRELEGVI
ncbi:hypothetical protein [Romboutsia timonensis]|uniref:hypothetical protein n=1 Tax=Romboutsia timonensis TaxID=1776391 RepID=UPI0023F69B51|nr:hypothetical protein [Romboutsia timonensis]